MTADVFPPRVGDRESFSAALIQALPEAAVVTDASQRIVSVNDAFTAMTGYAAAEAIGRNCRFLQGPGTDREQAAAIRRSLQWNAPFRGRLLNYRKNGEAFWNELAIVPVPGPSGPVTGFVGLQRDVTESVDDRAALLALLTQTERERATLGALLDVARLLGQEVSTDTVVRSVSEVIPELCGADRSAVAIWDGDTSRLTIASATGWPAGLAERMERVNLSPGESPELAELLVQRQPIVIGAQSSAWARDALERFEVASFAAMPIHSGGALRGLLLAYWTSADKAADLDESLSARLSGLAGLTAIALDNALLLEETHWSAAHDSLTGLPNRTTLERQLERALEQANGRAATAVIFCDVDGLKRTNDALGHDAGDQLLKEVARRIRAVVRPQDTVSRVGGDEFVILLAHVDGEPEVEDLVRRLEDALAAPLRIAGRSLSIRLSMGLAFSSDPLVHLPPSAAGTALIRAADLAMYQRKSRGASPLSGAPLGRLQRLAADLPGALGRGELAVHYQPQLDLAAGETVAVEALVRWTHPVLGPVQPDEFIPIAEMNGDIASIGEFVLHRALADISALRRDRPGLGLAVNVSNDQLDRRGFAAGIAEALRSSGMPFDALTLEITESKLPADRVVALAELSELRAAGIGIALDDFGTGYTSLAQLRDMPVTELKIDRSFVQQAVSRGPDLIVGIVGLARGLRLRVVAEGVSTAAHLDRVREVGFDRAQGFAIARPMGVAELAGFLGR
ncbi:MAG: EAL domain-containing protein [Acidobacteria bacterium]|nr:EAL domain-containing protein [Acidobacteriota bacterium]